MIEITNQLASLAAEQAGLSHLAWEIEMLIRKQQERWAEFAEAALGRKKSILSYFLKSVVVKSEYKVQIEFAI